MERRIIPKFATEAEEAKWWYDHREDISQDIVAASCEGRLGEGSKARFIRKQAEQQKTAAEAFEHRRAS
jgi:hypothetical protein